MATKTWKIGERCRGGILTVETTKTKVIIITKQWDFSTGSRKSSNQSQAQELYRKEVFIEGRNPYYDLSMYISDEATSYHADEILKWIETKVTLNKSDW